jgi:hypothetical protein
MITVYRNNIQRDIVESRLQEFLNAGWDTKIQASDEAIRLKPAAKTFAKPAVKEEQGNDQTNIQGE